MSLCYNCFQEIDDADYCPYCGFHAAADRKKYPVSLPHGTVLGGKYVTGRVLGQGGFGITYLAQDYRDKKLVAVKEFFPEHLAMRSGATVSTFTGDREEGFRYGKECFLSEAKTLAEFIGNPDIVRVYSYFEENNTAYFVMEYVDGISLKQYLQDQGGRIGYEDMKRIILPVMDALSAVHAKGIIHRDISPDNIYLTKDGTVKLLDFGAARYSLGDRSRSLDVVLKHGYAPKEQYTRHGRQGPYTDIYALAATMYECITGRIPPDAIDRMEEDDLIAPSVMGCAIPPEAEDAILKALSLSPADRFQSMEGFKKALTADENAPMQAIPPAASAVVFSEPAASDAATLPEAEEPSPDSESLVEAAAPEPIDVVDDRSDVAADTASAESVIPETDPEHTASEQKAQASEQKAQKKKKKLILPITAAALAVAAAIVLLILLLPKGSDPVDPAVDPGADSVVATDPSSDDETAPDSVDVTEEGGSTSTSAASKTNQPTTAPTTKPTTAPAATTKPAPAATTKPAPAATTKPAPAATTKPTTAPAATTKPAPAATTKPTPPAPKYVNIVIDGVTYQVKSGSTVTYSYYLSVSGEVIALHAVTSYDTGGLELLSDVGSSASYPIVGSIMLGNESPAGSIITVFSSGYDGKDFTSWNSVLARFTFRVTAQSGTYSINTSLRQLATDPGFVMIVKNGEVLGNINRAEGVLSY